MDVDDVAAFQAVRQPNMIVSQTKQIANETVQVKTQTIQSPTQILSGAAPSTIDSFNLGEPQIKEQYEGEMIRKTPEGKLKRYWYCLLGKELYVYKHQSDNKHKGMHTLLGTFIREEPIEHLDEETKLYPFKLYFP